MTTTTIRPKSPNRRPRSLPDDERQPRPLVFTPKAWLKWQYLCHAGPTEVAGFGLSAPDDPLRVEDVLVVRQQATEVTVACDDAAIADLFDRLVDQGIAPARFARIWLHTHPGESVVPSGTDEITFRRSFGHCDWAIMGILGRTGRTSARLRFAAGPGGDLELPVAVDWAVWPNEAETMAASIEQWKVERILIEPARLLLPMAFDAPDFHIRDILEHVHDFL